MSQIVVYRAKTILTMEPQRPRANHVALQDGRILAVGDADCAESWGAFTRSDALADCVVLPGFIEPAANRLCAAIWRYPYCGFHDRLDPDGTLHRGMTDIDAILARLDKLSRSMPPDTPLIAWGFDPIFFPAHRLTKDQLDAISSDRPILVIYADLRQACGNSLALAQAGLDTATDLPGVMRDAEGALTGEVREAAALAPILEQFGCDPATLLAEPKALAGYAALCQRAGVTSATDLVTSEADLTRMVEITSGATSALRLVGCLQAGAEEPLAALAEAERRRAAQGSDRLRLGALRLTLDGTLLGGTARLHWPHYVGRPSNGIWAMSREKLTEICVAAQKIGRQVQIEVNGDEAATVALDALSHAARAHPAPEARPLLLTADLLDPALLARCRALGVSCSFAASHVWYGGDQLAALSLGPDRAARLSPIRDAEAAGVPVALQSAAPMTPIAPLHTAWCAVMRQTMAGDTLGPAQKISVEAALRAITLGAASALGLDHALGSISTGKWADFALLGEDPTAVSEDRLHKVPVLGTVSGGVIHRT